MIFKKKIKIKKWTSYVCLSGHLKPHITAGPDDRKGKANGALFVVKKKIFPCSKSENIGVNINMVIK